MAPTYDDVETAPLDTSKSKDNEVADKAKPAEDCRKAQLRNKDIDKAKKALWK